jgi:undecaprenyl diphosphate synthase
MQATTDYMSDLIIPQPAILKPKYKFFTAEQHYAIKNNTIPRHIAIIPDGNRRWAKRQQTHQNNGHQNGADILIDIVRAAKELGIEAITYYTFSTENWVRSKEEVDFLMWLIESYLIEQRPTMLEEGIRLQTIGDLSTVPASLQATIAETKYLTKECEGIDMILAVNYGGRNEICRAIKEIVKGCDKGKINSEDINEELISKHLDTALWSDPDLFIRTSGEMRLSNFMIWQLSYTELYVCDALWPDFTSLHLYEAVLEFQKRERRLGN